MIKKLELVNFRNYQRREVEFSPGVNVIVGNNGAGKTNLLEAIYMLASGESFRAKRTEEVVTFQEVASSILGRVLLPDEEIELRIQLMKVVDSPGRMSRRYLMDGAGKRKSDFVGILTAVVFLPEDLELLSGSSDKRRKGMNLVLDQVSPVYAKARSLYDQALRRRNKALEMVREGRASKSSMIYWEQTMLKNGALLTDKRGEWVEFVNKIWQQSELFNQLKLIYQKSVISEERMAEYGDREMAAGHTLIGPHKDDWVVMDKGHNLAMYGSRGEQRMAVLALKAAEIYYLRSQTEVEPVLLLDDIFSELDETHREEVRRVMKGRQVIMTTALRDDLAVVPEGNVIELNFDAI